jgi:hypothetical protein
LGKLFLQTPGTDPVLVGDILPSKKLDGRGSSSQRWTAFRPHTGFIVTPEWMHATQLRHPKVRVAPALIL